MRIQNMASALASAVVVSIGAAALFSAPATASPAPPPSYEESFNSLLVMQKFDAWRDGTGGPYDLLDEKASWTITGNSLAAKTYPTREAFLSEVIRPFNARMSKPLSPTVHRMYAVGDTVIVFFDAAGVAKDERPYVNTYAWFLRMKNQRIVEAHAFFDALAFDDLWRRVPPTTER